MNAMLMNLPFALPDWLPGWVVLLLALPVLLYLLAFLLMPFSVFGVKARIESLEAQIDSLHEDLRMISMRASGGLPPVRQRNSTSMMRCRILAASRIPSAAMPSR